MSAGFFVVLLVAGLLVVLPSIVALAAGWRRGGATRIGATLGSVLIVSMAALFLVPSDWPSTYEEKTVIFLAAWGVLFAASVLAAVLLKLAKRLTRLARGIDQSRSQDAKHPATPSS